MSRKKNKRKDLSTRRKGLGLPLVRKDPNTPISVDRVHTYYKEGYTNMQPDANALRGMVKKDGDGRCKKCRAELSLKLFDNGGNWLPPDFRGQRMICEKCSTAEAALAKVSLPEKKDKGVCCEYCHYPLVNRMLNKEGNWYPQEFMNGVKLCGVCSEFLKEDTQLPTFKETKVKENPYRFHRPTSQESFVDPAPPIKAKVDFRDLDEVQPPKPCRFCKTPLKAGAVVCESCNKSQEVLAPVKFTPEPKVFENVFDPMEASITTVAELSAILPPAQTQRTREPQKVKVEIVKIETKTCRGCLKPVTKDEVYEGRWGVRSHGTVVCKSCFSKRSGVNRAKGEENPQKLLAKSVPAKDPKPASVSSGKVCIKCSAELIAGENWLKSYVVANRYVCAPCGRAINKEHSKQSKARRTQVLDLRSTSQVEELQQHLNGAVSEVILEGIEHALKTPDLQVLPPARTSDLPTPTSWITCGCCNKQFVAGSLKHDLGRGIKCCDWCAKKARCNDCGYEIMIEDASEWSLIKNGPHKFGFICRPCHTKRFEQAGITLKRADTFGVPVEEMEAVEETYTPVRPSIAVELL